MEKRLRHEGNKTFRNEAIKVFMTEKNKEFQELVDLFHEMRKNFPFRYLEFPKIVSKNRVDARIGNLMYQGQLIRDVKNSILRYWMKYNPMEDGPREYNKL